MNNSDRPRNCLFEPQPKHQATILSGTQSMDIQGHVGHIGGMNRLSWCKLSPEEFMSILNLDALRLPL